MTHGDGEAARRGESVPRREHAWTAGLARLAEELEAFTGRLLDAQRALGASQSPLPPPSRPPRRPAPAARWQAPRAGSSLHERLDATERLVAHLEEERRRDGAARIVALSDAARRLEHAQEVIERSQRRLAAVSDPSILVGDEPLPPPPVMTPPPPRERVPVDLLERVERGVRRVEGFESQMEVWEQELSRQAALLERVAQSCHELEADLATRDEIELHIATLIERLSRSIARAPLL